MSIYASHIIKRNEIYHFRLAIPTDLRDIYKQREIRKSLKTAVPETARARAHILYLKCNQLFMNAREMPQSKTFYDIKQLLREDGSKEITLSDVKAEDIEILKQLKAEGIIPDHSNPQQPSQASTSSIKLSEASTRHIEEKRRSGSLTERSQKAYETATEFMIDIIGDVGIDQISTAEARSIKNTLLKLPPNRKKIANYRGLTITELTDLNLPDSKTMGIETINGNLTKMGTLMKWAKANGFSNSNPFEDIKLKSKRKASDARGIFTEEDLLKLFSIEQYQKHEYKHPYYYWLPLIGLHTGARLNEICQLHLDDIKQEDDKTWCFFFTAEHIDQDLKTAYSKRVVPIHSKLVELGLLDFKKSLERRGETRLFPELKKGRDGYSTAASKWFGRIRNKLGWTNVSPKKDFHSFRHTVANKLKQSGVNSDLTGGILGHSNGTITYGRYGKEYTHNPLSPVIEMIDWDASINHIRKFRI